MSPQKTVSKIQSFSTSFGLLFGGLAFLTTLATEEIGLSVAVSCFLAFWPFGMLGIDRGKERQGITISLFYLVCFSVIVLLALHWYIPAFLLGWLFAGYYAAAVMESGWQDKDKGAYTMATLLGVPPFFIIVSCSLWSEWPAWRRASLLSPTWEWPWR